MTATALRLLLGFSAAAVIAAAPAAADPDGSLRVCADPNNLPFSNQRLEEFENKLAELVATEFGVTPQYSWMPQRRGFIRRTLNARTCDVVMGVPSGYDPVLTTKPYYRSTYVFAYAKARGLELRSFDDPELRQLRIGLQALVNEGSNPPPARALTRRGIVQNVVGFMMWDVDTVENPPGRIISAITSGDIDVAIVWGPFAGYFAKRQPIELDVVPVTPLADTPALPFVYDISMGVRRSDSALKDRLDDIIASRHDAIERILTSYGVPLVADQTPIIRP